MNDEYAPNDLIQPDRVDFDCLSTILTAAGLPNETRSNHMRTSVGPLELQLWLHADHRLIYFNCYVQLRTNFDDNQVLSAVNAYNQANLAARAVFDNDTLKFDGAVSYAGGLTPLSLVHYLRVFEGQILESNELQPYINPEPILEFFAPER